MTYWTYTAGNIGHLRGTGNMEMSCAFLITARSSALALGFSVPVR
jgi:hypothetical protein